MVRQQNGHSKLTCFSLPWDGSYAGPTAAVERAHSYRARSGSTGVALTALPSPILASSFSDLLEYASL
jgi:hypothetical protein